MPQSDTESNNFNSHESHGNVSQTIERFVDATEQLAAELDAPDVVTSEFVDAGDELARVVEETTQQVDQNVDNIKSNVGDIESNKDELKEAKEHSGRERAELSKRVSGVEETIEDVGLDDATPTPNSGKTNIQHGDLTPVEQLSRADDPSEVTDSPTVERAVSLFKNLPRWGSKTPKGVVLKPADNPLSLLEADQGESLAWKQYYRAAEALEQLSEGSVTFFDSDRHGKMIVLHKQSEAYERTVNGSLSPSSVGAEG
jgi:hypothetical protein